MQQRDQDQNTHQDKLQDIGDCQDRQTRRRGIEQDVVEHGRTPLGIVTTLVTAAERSNDCSLSVPPIWTPERTRRFQVSGIGVQVLGLGIWA